MPSKYPADASYKKNISIVIVALSSRGVNLRLPIEFQFLFPKGTESDPNPINFLSYSANISSRSVSSVLCVHAKNSGVCTQPWLCKRGNEESVARNEARYFSNLSATGDVFPPITKTGERKECHC